MDPSSPKGKDFRETFENDDISKIAAPPYVGGIPEAIARVRAKLGQPSYAAVYAEYEKRKTKMNQKSALANTKRNEENMAEIEKNGQQECKQEKPAFRERIQQLMEDGAKNPYSITMSDWYYLKEHAEKCERCAKEFERLAKEARKEVWFEGPTTLRTSV